MQEPKLYKNPEKADTQNTKIANFILLPSEFDAAYAADADNGTGRGFMSAKKNRRTQ